MTEVWRELRVGDKVRLVEIPPELLRPGYFVHRNTMRVYKRLLARHRPLRICVVERGGPWIHCRFRRKNDQFEYHWLMFNHGGIVRVKPRNESSVGCPETNKARSNVTGPHE